MDMQQQIVKILKEKSEKRFIDFEIDTSLKSISRISEDSYLENPTWLGGDDEFVCLFIDLDNSSKLSFKKHPKTMAKIYDYFTQNIVDILNTEGIRADYIDIKGDGAFGIYEGEDAAKKAFCAAVTFKTFFEKCVRPKFQTETDVINCKIAIDKNKILVRRLGKRGDRNNNEVWAGRVVNNASKLASISKKIYNLGSSDFQPNKRSLLVISEKIYTDLDEKRDYAINSCGHNENGEACLKSNVWKDFDCSQDEDVLGDRVWYTSAIWCSSCGDTYMSEILS